MIQLWDITNIINLWFIIWDPEFHLRAWVAVLQSE